MGRFRRTGIRVLISVLLVSTQSALVEAVACSCLCCDSVADDAVCVHRHPTSPGGHRGALALPSAIDGHDHGADVNPLSSPASQPAPLRCCCGKLTMATALIHPGVTSASASLVVSWTALEPVAGWALPGILPPPNMPPTPPPRS